MPWSMTPDELQDQLTIYREQLERGDITREEYDMRVERLMNVYHAQQQFSTPRKQ